MFRARKTALALFATLVLVAMQLHGVLHWLGIERHEEGSGSATCALCAQNFHQQSLAAQAPVQVAPAPLGFALAERPNASFQPRFRCFAPLFRGPPTVS